MNKLFYILFFVSLAAKAQDFKSDYEASSKAFTEMDKYSMEIAYVQFDSTAKQGTYVAKSIVKKYDSHYYMNALGKEIIADGKKVVAIDHNNKRVKYYLNYSQDFNSGKITADRITEMLSNSDTVIYNGTKDGIKSYSVVPSGNTDLMKVEVLFDEKSKMMIKMTEYYFPSEGNLWLEKKETIYRFLSVEDLKKDSVFEFEKVLSFKKDGAELNEDYKKKYYTLQILSN